MLKRLKLYLAFLSIISTLVILNWKKLKLNSRTLTLYYNQQDLLPDDFKIITGKNEEQWNLGNIRRSPLKQNYQNISYSNLPELIEAQILKDLGSENRTKSDTRVIIYNRVPKTGSSTMQNLLALQSDERFFHYYKSDYYWNRVNSVKSEIQLIQMLKNFTVDTIYDQHIYFIDIARYDKEFSANWINIVRDPVERFVSDFYYNRQKERWQDVEEKPPKEWFEKDLSECLINSDPECDFNPDYLVEQQLTYFCGSAAECREIGNRRALNVAKYNAEVHYSVIGVTEHFRISFAVFEHYLPRYFSHFLRLYGRQQFLNQANDKVTTNKRPITLQARKILEKRLSLDIEFFDFLLQRLFTQATKCGILPDT